MMEKPFIPINQQWIHEQLIGAGYPQPFQLECFIELPSTNTYLKASSVSTPYHRVNHLANDVPRLVRGIQGSLDTADKPRYVENLNLPCDMEKIPNSNRAIRSRRICIAEQQTAGRGRFGRSWSSPFGENIYLSFGWPYQGVLADLSGLSLVVALTVAKLFQHVMHVPCHIKWPNDILCDQKKIAGILIELNGQPQGERETIIGIGINVNTNTQKTPLSDNPHCSLFDVTGYFFDRNQLIVDLLIGLEEDLLCFAEQGFSAFHAEWEKLDYLLHKRVSIRSGSRILEGTAEGVNEQGLLQIKTDDGISHLLSSGEVSLHN